MRTTVVPDEHRHWHSVSVLERDEACTAVALTPRSAETCHQIFLWTVQRKDILEFENVKYQILYCWFWKPLIFFMTPRSKHLYLAQLVYIRVYVHTCVHAYDQRITSDIIVWHCLPFLRQGVPLAWGLRIWLGWPVRKPQGPPHLALSGCWGSQVCRASTLFNEPLLAPCSL